MDKIIEFYKEQYFFELERKGQLAGNLPIPIGFMTVIFSISSYFGLNIYCLFGHWSLLVFSFISCFSIFFIIKASIYLKKAFIGKKYGYMPSLDKIYNFENKNKNNPNLDSLLFNGIKEAYVISATENRKNNNYRADSLYLTNKNTIYAILFLSLSAIPFFIGKNNYDLNNSSLTKKTIVMARDLENEKKSNEDENPSSEPDTSDFPKVEWVTEGLKYVPPTQPSDSSSDDKSTLNEESD